MRDEHSAARRVPAGAVTVTTIVTRCRACAYIGGSSLALPRHQDDVLYVHPGWVDEQGWVHDHPICEQTDEAAERLFGFVRPVRPSTWNWDPAGSGSSPLGRTGRP